ncbi:uncharacterized protein si:ch211-80h18.1 [Etheostoma cragini]|uniref:uncharacterized protein si:ch211-80h18.1 n=1 Tax=Etheostoma cragini TaxID=417921 RepID=UPI00155F0C70|nr:uncharacterized protein si:ch211-80h18.1 [Etheostoma cragini]
MLTATNADVTMMSSGGAETVTSLHIDLTASGRGHDVTESSPIFLYTDTGVLTASTGTDSTISTGTGSPLDLSLPAVTDQTAAGPAVTEQYNPSGQGPEGAENVELEDTC